MIKVNAKELNFALGLMKDIVPQDAHMPILKFVKLEVIGQTLRISGVDRHKSGSITIQLEESKKDEVCILLLEDLSRVVSIYQKESELVAIKFLKNNVNIFDQTNGKDKLLYGSLEDYPTIYEPTGDSIDIIPSEFIKNLGLSSFSNLNSDKYRNVHLVSENGELATEAMNIYCGGRAVAEVSYNLDFDIAVDSSIERPLAKMAKIAVEDEVWKLSIENNKLYIAGFNWFISYSLFMERYPNLEGATRNSEINNLTVPREKFLYTLQKVMAKADTSKVLLSIKDGIITLSNVEGSKHSLAVEFEGQEDNEVILNTYNLRKMLNEVKTEEVQLQIGTKAEQFIVHNGDTTYFSVPYKNLD